MDAVEGLVFHLWQPAAWLRIAGPDAPSFLQGQFTNDVRLAAPGKAVYGLWLDQKGKVLADSFILADKAGGFHVGSYFSSAETIRRRLEAYLVADDVTVEDLTPVRAGAALIGTDAVDRLERLAAGRGFVFSGRRGAGECAEWVFPAADVRAELAAMAREIGAEEMERRRVDASLPAVPADIGPGELPQEGGLEAGAISATNGCYLGQEIMARLQSRGSVRRHLVRVAGRGPVPRIPAPLFRDGNAVGELRSAVAEGGGFRGLALVPRAVGGPFALGGPGGGAVEIV